MITPKLNLNFVSAVLDPRVSFTRTTGVSNPATYTNSSGYITDATNNQARFNYDPITLICDGFLVEDASANLFFRSEEFNNGFWNPNSLTVSGTNVVSPRNTLTAQHVYPASSGSRYFNGAVSVTGGLSYTLSVFAKASGLRWIYLGVGGALTQLVFFDLENGVIGAVGNALPFVPFIERAANGFYRCGLTYTRGSTGTANNIIGISDANNTTTVTANSTDGIDFFGGQFEQKAFATSYIPTTTTALTRNADVATITGTNFSGFWRSGPGSILVRALPSTVSGTRPLVQVDDATADNIIALRGNTTNPELYVRAGGADQATIDAGTISAAAYRLAGAWQAGSAAAALNSGLAVNGAPASIPAATQMRLGSDGTNYLNGHLQAVQYWPLRLSNASLQNASSTAGYQSIIHPVSRDTIITEPV